MYDKTVTVFNRYENAMMDAVTWYPHVFHNVDLIIDQAANREKTGLENADKAKLHIKHMNRSINGIPCLSPKAWENQINDDLSKTVTFHEGVDFFIEGAYDDLLPIDDDSYREGFFNFMNKTRDNVFRITSCGIYDLIPHIEIGGA